VSGDNTLTQISSKKKKLLKIIDEIEEQISRNDAINQKFNPSAYGVINENKFENVEEFNEELGQFLDQFLEENPSQNSTIPQAQFSINDKIANTEPEDGSEEDHDQHGDYFAFITVSVLILLFFCAIVKICLHKCFSGRKQRLNQQTGELSDDYKQANQIVMEVLLKEQESFEPKNDAKSPQEGYQPPV
jgi:hypothetical protein